VVAVGDDGGANSWLAKEKKNGGTDWKMKGNGAPVQAAETRKNLQKPKEGGGRRLSLEEKKIRFFF